MVVNGDFETGELTNWSVVGNAEVIEGSASINNDFGSAPDNVVENFLNLTSGTLYQFHKIALQIDPYYPLIKGRTRKVSVTSI